MKNHHDESIIALAFGELTEAEATKLKAEIAGNEESRELLAGYAAMKEDLKRLEVPPHQLSTERLRDAILGQGLKPKPVFPWKLAWMPVAAAAVAVLASQFMGSGRDAGSVAISTTDSAKSASALDPSLRFDPVGDLVLESLPDLRDELPPANETVRAEKSGNTKNLSYNRRSSRRAETRVAVMDSAAKTVTEKPSADSFDTTTAPFYGDNESKEGSAIVLIEKERDTNTGASRAIEISDPNNVVIGG